jgi:hypothetical protein
MVIWDTGVHKRHFWNNNHNLWLWIRLMSTNWGKKNFSSCTGKPFCPSFTNTIFYLVSLLVSVLIVAIGLTKKPEMLKVDKHFHHICMSLIRLYLLQWGVHPTPKPLVFIAVLLTNHKSSSQMLLVNSCHQCIRRILTSQNHYATAFLIQTWYHFSCQTTNNSKSEGVATAFMNFGPCPFHTLRVWILAVILLRIC